MVSYLTYYEILLFYVNYYNSENKIRSNTRISRGWENGLYDYAGEWIGRAFSITLTLIQVIDDLFYYSKFLFRTIWEIWNFS